MVEDARQGTRAFGQGKREGVGLIKGSRGGHRESRGRAPAASDDAEAGARRAAQVAQWRRAARHLTSRPDARPSPRKRVKAGGDGKGMARFTTRGMAEDYLELCRNPLKDLRRWLAEDKKRPGGKGGFGQHTTRNEGDYEQDTRQARLANADGIRRQPLPPVPRGMDAHRERGRRFDRVLARPRTGARRYDELRQVRAEGQGKAGGVTWPSGAARPDSSFKAERSAILALYGAKIEATRRSVSARDMSAALRALFDEQRDELRAANDRRKASERGAREHVAAERFSARLAQKSARAEPAARPT